MTTLHDTLYGYATLLDRGHADMDLAPDDAAQVARRIHEAVNILHGWGGTTRSDLVRMFAQPTIDGTTVAGRVADIIRNV